MEFNFPNRDGVELKGKLENSTGNPKAYAIFAHCFTCSKDIIAASAISKSLTSKGISVLRFDFTGLGNSDGDFSNTNFSSNVEDLLSAYNEIEHRFEAPKLLIGHSFGGAAVLKAAGMLKTAKAVVTIAAPSDVKHIQHMFKDELDNINKTGQARVVLAGREFTLKKQFIDDINEADILVNLKELRKALLVMHSPLDSTVSIDHAAKIFSAAHHPKSFISLDKADHLLMKKSDAEYVGNVIGAWAQKYIS
ncbi:alpha/beta hydrolase family protein [Microbulbifer sp. SSSA007]|uniref:alpha/beta hydrolase family protein n=1 Tax=Microbulbifer sp. SSSA007 TaxID=3243379 RepID=UPI004039105C